MTSQLFSYPYHHRMQNTHITLIFLVYNLFLYVMLVLYVITVPPLRGTVKYTLILPYSYSLLILT
jgi:hypothetical protein